MKQQTAVEWLLNAIETKNGKEFSSYYTEFIEQAKEMEKQNLEKFYDHGSLSLLETGHGDTFENYYNKTFKNK